jgi:L-fucose mutarotase
MEVVGEPDNVLPVQQEVQLEINRAEGRERIMGSIERFDFYDVARTAYCVIATGERRFYGCFVFKKGVIAPEA